MEGNLPLACLIHADEMRVRKLPVLEGVHFAVSVLFTYQVVWSAAGLMFASQQPSFPSLLRKMDVMLCGRVPSSA